LSDHLLNVKPGKPIRSLNVAQTPDSNELLTGFDDSSHDAELKDGVEQKLRRFFRFRLFFHSPNRSASSALLTIGIYNAQAPLAASVSAPAWEQQQQQQ
jgi:hypothetical protein